MHVNPKWFDYHDNYRFTFTARDDNDEYCDRSNMQLYGQKAGPVGIGMVQDVAYKSLKLHREFVARINQVS